MANEVLRYTRSFVRSLKKNQRVRLTATVTPAAGDGVYNKTARFGEYARLRGLASDLYFAYSHFPTPPFEFEQQATFSGTADRGAFAWLPDRRIVMLYRDAGDIWSQTSHDDGLTYEPSFYSPGSRADIALHPDGSQGIAVYQLGGMTFATVPPGEGGFVPGNTVVDGALLPLSFENDNFRLVADSRGWWWAHWRLAGSGATSLWFSTESGEAAALGVHTWAPTSGAVSGIAGATHPGICEDGAGGLVAWAYSGGKAMVMRREAGAVDWTAAVAAKNDAAVDLAIQDAPFSIAPAWEGPARLVLAVNIAGETAVSDWHSADAGTSFARFP